MVRGQPRTPVAPSTASSSTSSSRSAAAASDANAGPSRGGALGGSMHAHGPSHYRPYPSPHHQFGAHGSMIGAAGAGLSPMLGGANQFNGILPNVMGSDSASSLGIDFAREMSQPGMGRRGSYQNNTHNRLPTQQQVSMRMHPGRGSISSE